MSIESELKIIPRENLKQEEVLDLLKQNGYIPEGNFKTKKQEDTYYDDSNKTLYKNNCSFRIRRTGNKAVVTYKSPINSNTEYKQREELEATIPEIYIQEDGSIMVEDAIDILRKEYPDVVIPQKLEMAAKVINNRSKINIHAQDGTKIEMAFDDLRTENATGNKFKMNNELECEAISGNPNNLDKIYKLVSQNYDIQKNELSKYSRAIKEMNEQRDNMSLEEIVVCTMLSDILKSKEFEQLKFKGQMIHNYTKTIPDNLSLDNFKNPEYLINKISEVRRTKNYRPGKIKNLEDMFLCFFSDMSYKDIEYKLVNFLNENYYNDDTPITNRMLHSQQVMLITGLISRSNEISENERKTLLTMSSALVHDIGHVPGAHATEEVLGGIDGFFSHEINGRNIIEKIITSDEDNIEKTIKEYGQSLGKEYNEQLIREYIQKNKTQIKKSIEAHSRTNSEKRGDGTVVQLPREADKICYSVSDIVDVVKSKIQNEETPVEFFTNEWKEKIIKKLGKGYEREAEIKQKMEEIEKLINTNNFGEIVTNVANTIRENVNDGKTYYDVEQDTWNIINEMIKYVKDLRKTGVVDNKRTQIQQASTFFIINKFNEHLKKTNGNIEEAWEQTLETVTKSNDIDILNHTKEIEETYRNNPDLLKKAFEVGGAFDISKLQHLDNADRQIKLQPKGRFQMSDLQPYLRTTI